MAGGKCARRRRPGEGRAGRPYALPPPAAGFSPGLRVLLLRGLLRRRLSGFHPTYCGLRAAGFAAAGLVAPAAAGRRDGRKGEVYVQGDD
jgi:hypothetical protein